MRVVLGGTFNPPIHKGHRELLNLAFELARGGNDEGGGTGEVAIGLTSDEMVGVKEGTLPYTERVENLRQFINREFGALARIIKINDPYGVTLSEDFDYIVVSPETYRMAQKINQARKEKAMSPIKIVKIDHVLDEGGKVISSTRIKRGEIDEDGTVF